MQVEPDRPRACAIAASASARPSPAPARRALHVEPLHLAGLVVDAPERDAPALGEEHEHVEAERIGELRLEVLEREIDAEPVGVFAEERPHDLDVVARGPVDHDARVAAALTRGRRKATMPQCRSQRASSSRSRTSRASALLGDTAEVGTT